MAAGEFQSIPASLANAFLTSGLFKILPASQKACIMSFCRNGPQSSNPTRRVYAAFNSEAFTGVVGGFNWPVWATAGGVTK